jgi:hypothetical protein
MFRSRTRDRALRIKDHLVTQDQVFSLESRPWLQSASCDEQELEQESEHRGSH